MRPLTPDTMSNSLRPLRLLPLTLALASQPLLAQTMTMRAGDGLVLRVGVGSQVVVKTEGGAVVVEGVVNDAAGSGPDLVRGDRIVRAMGTPIATTEALLNAISGVEVGAVVRLGIVRGAQAEREFTFARQPRPSGATMAVAGGEGAGQGAWTTAGSGGAAGFSIAGAGIIENNEGMPEVSHRGAHPAAATVALRAGDVITQVDGRSIAALAGLTMLYEKVAVGARVRLTVQRGGEVVEVAFDKPAP